VPLISAFPSMALTFNATYQGHPLNQTEAYSTVYVSATTYKVNVTSNPFGLISTSTAWILKNGTVLAIYSGGANTTGFSAQGNAEAAFQGFFEDESAASQLSTYGSYFKATGTSSVTIGTNTFTVTNYQLATSGVSTQGCGGVSGTLNTENLSIGTPSGSSTGLVTYFQLSATVTYNGQVENVSWVIKVTSFTLG
jgi:hypothetical protein